MPCPECPETPDTGCLHPITTECVTYNGNDVDCANISSGQSLNQVIEQLANNDCDVQEQIEDIIQDIEDLSGNVIILQNDLEELSGSVQTQINNIPVFSCEDLSGCSINSLSDVDVSPVSGDSMIYNGVKWVHYTPESIDSFSCSDLSGCTLDNLGNVVETSSASGDVLINNGIHWINQSFASLYTATNGLTKTSNNIKLGGTLLENTSITGNYDIYFGNNNYIFGDDATIIGSTVVKFAHKLTKSLNSLPGGFSTNYKNSIFTIDTAFSLSAGTGLFNDNNLTRLYVNNSKSIAYSCKAANQASYLQLRGVGTPTLTLTGASGNIATLSNHLSYTQLDNDTDDAANKAVVSHYSNYNSLLTAVNTNHNAITNFYHLFLSDITNNLPSPSYITNKYGIYQEGTTETNVFNGLLRLPNLPTYADEAAAIVGGLITGTVYKTNTGELRIKL